MVNSASFEGPPVMRGGFLTIYTDTPVTDEGATNFPFAKPGTFASPGGVSVETDECGGTLGPVGPNTRLPLLYIGPSGFGGTQINFYYPNATNPASEMFGTCFNGGFDRFTVRPKAGFGQPRVRDINTNSFRIGLFANGAAPVGYHLNAKTGAPTPFAAAPGLPSCNSNPGLCPVATNGISNFLILFTTGGESLSCPNRFQPCDAFTRANFRLSRVNGPGQVGPPVDQRVTFYGPVGFLGQEQANVQLLTGTSSGEYRLEVQGGVEVGFPVSVQRLTVHLGPPTTV